jgi:hypothetical protein
MLDPVEIAEPPELLGLHARDPDQLDAVHVGVRGHVLLSGPAEPDHPGP